MKTLGNVLWFILIGLWLCIMLFLVGALWCVTIVGIPVGVQCFKIGRFAALPFGKETTVSGRAPSLVLNFFWMIFGGLEIALCAAVCGIVMLVSIIGIPFGIQAFKIAKLVLLPFGAEIIYIQR